MRRTLRALVVAAIGIVSWPVTAVFAQANSNKTRGTVSALGADSVTVKVRDAEMKFSVTPRTIVEARGIAQVSDEGAIAEVVDRVLAANAGVADEYRAGDEVDKKKKWGFLMGQVMRELKGQGNAQVINGILERRLAGD